MDLALNEAPNGRTGYFIGKEETCNPKCYTFNIIDIANGTPTLILPVNP
jgi:hypothetical protein